MSAQIIDGKAIAERIRAEVQAGAAQFSERYGRAPALHLVLVGDESGSASLVRSKARHCEKTGLIGAVHALPPDVEEAALLELLAELNRADEVDGILVQLPLPAPLSAAKFTAA